MNLEERIESLNQLGVSLRSLLNGTSESFQGDFDNLITKQYKTNPWFTPENVRLAFTAIANELTRDNLNKWTAKYPLLNKNTDPLTVGVIMAGNIPLVGFHDFISVLVSGNKLLAKTSSKDSELIVLCKEILCSINNELNDRIKFTEGTLTNFDVVIATGSNNSSRYFESYFGKYPHIIRKNRNSVAVLDGSETASELIGLGSDIFSYFGLGCRNISKIYVPEGYDISSLPGNWSSFSNIISHQKYSSNYDFNKAVFIVNKVKFHDSGFLIMTEDNRISSPVSVLHYEFYKNKNEAEILINSAKGSIQSVVSRHAIPFGKAQAPHLWDYADDIDTIDFLLKKNNT